MIKEYRNNLQDQRLLKIEASLENILENHLPHIRAEIAEIKLNIKHILAIGGFVLATCVTTLITVLLRK